MFLKDVGQKMKEQFKMYPDEFVTSPLAAKARVCYTNSNYISFCVCNWVSYCT